VASLKAYIPGLARILGTTPDALYERQRALVRAGLIDTGEGRGPGSGARATAPAVALLLISTLATDRLNESGFRAQTLANARPKNGSRCPFTGMVKFADALATVLTQSRKTAGVIEITISRTADRAEIKYRTGTGPARISEFTGPSPSEPGISVAATLNNDLLQTVASDVQSIILESFNNSEDES